MKLNDCIICQSTGLKESKVIPGLYYCFNCNNFIYVGEGIHNQIHIVLREIYSLTKFRDLLTSQRMVGLISDLCNVQGQFLDLLMIIISSSAIDIDTLYDDLLNNEIEGVVNYNAHKLETQLMIDYDYCEYIIKLFCYALGKDIIIYDPYINTEEKFDSNVIKVFKQSTNKVLRGNSVEFSWDIRGKHIKIKLVVGEKVITIKNPRYTKRILISESSHIVLIVESKNSHIEIARKSLFVEVVDPVEILAFSASRLVSIESMPIILKWKVENADRIILFPNQIDVTSENQIMVNPMKSTTFSIKATNGCSTQERYCTISVKPLPSIQHVKIPFIEHYNGINLNVQFPGFTIPDLYPDIRVGIFRLKRIKRLYLPDFEDGGDITKINPNFELWGIIKTMKSLFSYFNGIYRI